MIPVEVAEFWEVLVLPRRIGDIPHHCVDVFHILLGEPAWVKMANDSGSVDEVAIMEVVIVVEGVAKIRAVVACLICGG